MLIYFFEPFYTGSHKAWIEGYQNTSEHKVKVFSLKGKNWKWRMHGGAITLTGMLKKDTELPELIIVSDMMDLCIFKSLLPKKWQNIPIIIYFHENQLSYPWNPEEKDLKLNRERHYAFINYTSALAADHCFFNSKYHMEVFLTDLRAFLKAYPDHRNMNTINEIKVKSQVLYLGLELKRFNKLKHDTSKNRNNKPVFLWNHRWDHDKNPKAFIMAFNKIHDLGYEFEVIIAGEEYENAKEDLLKLKKRLGSKVIHFGYAESFEDYAQLLWKADYLPVTSLQDFFGISIAEAMYCKCTPILPERLTYKELFSNGSLFYKDDDELIKILIDLIKKWPSKNITIESDSLNDFDWSNMVKKYDQLFKSLVNEHY
jgi:glycosyltransferase involved in cell wall biosynthesis